MALHGIDISHHQGNIDYETVKNSGQVDFVIIKAGGSDSGFYEDSMFREYLNGFQSAGIPVLGAYYFVGSGCTSAEDGIADADRFCDMLDGTGIPYAFLDLESTDSNDIDGATEASIAFMDRCIERGYKTGIYASDISGFQNRLRLNMLGGYKKWVARYGSEPQYVSDYAMWQYSSTECIAGINENSVDCNYLYDEEMINSISGNPDSINESINSGDWSREQAINVIDGMYNGLFNRGYNPGENEGLENLLMHEWTRVRAFDDLRNSDEYNNNHFDPIKLQLIKDCYMVMRGCEPSLEEISDWIQYDEDTIKHGILYSDEFNNKFGV